MRAMTTRRGHNEDNNESIKEESTKTKRLVVENKKRYRKRL